jgi:hypothetical protein
MNFCTNPEAAIGFRGSDVIDDVNAIIAIWQAFSYGNSMSRQKHACAFEQPIMGVRWKRKRAKFSGQPSNIKSEGKSI